MEICVLGLLYVQELLLKEGEVEETGGGRGGRKERFALDFIVGEGMGTLFLIVW